jgi:hypothetical protein
MTGQGNYSYAVAIIIIVIIVIILVVVFTFFWSDKNSKNIKKSKSSKKKCKIGSWDQTDPNGGMNGGMDGGMDGGMNEGMNEGMNGGIDSSCDIAAICRQAFQTGEEGAKKVVNATLDFLEKNPNDLCPLADISNNFNGYPIVIKPGKTLNDAVILYDINPNIVGVPIGSLNNPEVLAGTKAILDGAAKGKSVVCYMWQGRTKVTYVTTSRDGKLVVASGFHLDATQ